MDVDVLATNIGEAFRLRHILAHEAAPRLVVDAETCARALDSVQQWIEAVAAVIWATVYKDVPLSTYEMNMHARGKVQSARTELAKHLRNALEAERKNGSAKWLRENHRDWHRVVTTWAQQTYGRLEGTMWPSVGGYDLADAIAARAKQMAAWVRSTDPG
ncbi:lysozyme inhibitor LprI family protein [Variovorax sp. OV329]|uniref:lysozyme inhibitor LprI family protein n=1 Tax=Variovorax sp. OV329 TaxID=1882825 RepID=UPI0011135103|nr:lysozyme inhibitor LprI family protein [Variovorax sp. OV329]